MSEIQASTRLPRVRSVSGAIGVCAILALGLEAVSPQLDPLALLAFLALAVAIGIAFVESRRAPRNWALSEGELSKRSPSPDRRRWLVAFAVVGMGAVVAIQIWFGPGTAVAGGDITFPNGTAWIGRMFSPWAFSGANLGGPSLLQTQLPWGIVLGLVQSIGGSAELAQRIWYTLLFTGAGLGAVALLRTLGVRPLPAACGAFVYLFNGYVLGWVNINPNHLAALAILPTVMACILAGAKGTLRIPVAAMLLAATAPLLGVASQNPPLVAMILLPIVGCPLLAAWLGGRRAAIRGLRVLALGLPLLILASLYWLVPAALAYSTLGNANFSPTTSWRFTEIRATLGNALWLNNVWTWGHPEYVPYAARYLVEPLALAKYLLPALAFAPIAFLKSNALPIRGRGLNLLGLSAVFAGVALLFEFLSTGTLPPGSTVFDFLYSLPGGVLLREPGRFLMLAALAYSVLVAVTATWVTEVLVGKLSRSFAKDWLRSVRAALRRSLPYGEPSEKPKVHWPRWRIFVPLAPVTGAVLFVAALVPAYPLMTGAVVPGQRTNLPSTHVNLPTYWQRMFDDVNRVPGSGALLVLPPDDYYAMPYQFGYYGNDGFIVQSVARHVLIPNPQGYLRKSPELLAAVDAVANNLLRSNDGGAAQIMATLQSSLVLVRGDIDPSDFLQPGRHIDSPRDLSSALKASSHFALVRREGPLELYRLTDAVPVELATASRFATVNTSSPDLSILSLLAPGTDVVTSAPERGVQGIFTLPDLSQWDVSSGQLSAALRVPTSGWTYQLQELGTPAQGLQLSSTAGTGGEQALTLSVPLGSQNLIPNGNFSAGIWEQRAGDCANSHPGTHPDTSLISASQVDGPSGYQALRLSTSIDTACESQALKPTSGPILLRLMVRNVVGAAPRICLWDYEASHCAATPAIPTGSGWLKYQAVVVPGPNTTRLRLFLDSVAQASCQGGECTTSETINEFADVEAFSLPAVPHPIVLATPTETGSTEHLLVLRDTFSSDWQGPSGSQHVVVDGLFNGWLGADVSPQVSYGPGPPLTAATAVSSATLAALVVVGIAPAATSAWRTRRRLVDFARRVRHFRWRRE